MESKVVYNKTGWESRPMDLDSARILLQKVRSILDEKESIHFYIVHSYRKRYHMYFDGSSWFIWM